MAGETHDEIEIMLRALRPGELLNLASRFGTQIARDDWLGVEAFDLVEPGSGRPRIGIKSSIAADFRQARRVSGDYRTAEG